MSTAQHKIWCDEDEHFLFEYFADFNEWLESDEGQEARDERGVENLPQPSKALFSGDREAYDEAFQEYRKDRRHEALNETYLVDQFDDDHWFQRNVVHFEQLVDLMEKGEVVPFIGAGVSASGGFPSWKDHLRQQGKTANIDPDHIEELLESGAYEAVLKEIEDIRGRDVFIQEIRDVFSRTGTIPDAVWQISETFTDTLITTNYDRLIEQAFDTGEKDPVQTINGMTALETRAPNKTAIIKLHGNIQNPERCILSKDQYDKAYGNGSLDMQKAIPKLLSYHYENSSLLFLGCSLVEDRTVKVFRKVKDSMGEEDEFRQHFSIEQAPEDKDELADRNEYLARLGITPIWFEKERYEYVESILRLAKNELRHRGVIPEMKPAPEAVEKGVNLDLDLNRFLHDFIALMPLMHWLHQAVPQAETNKYLCAMQRVFYAHSIATEQTDENLIDGLEKLLRALSNNPCFDGYTHGNLSEAFQSIQSYLKSIGQEHHVGDSFEWNVHEMLTIPTLQLESLVEQKNDGSLDYHTIRLIIALFQHGKKQRGSPKNHCELPQAVNHEFGDYLSLALSKNFGITVPDRLDHMLTSEIQVLCEDAWNDFERPIDLKFFEQVKLNFLRLLNSLSIDK